MKKNSRQSTLKTILTNAGFVMCVVISTMVLLYWIFTGAPFEIYLIILISLLNGGLFMLFFRSVTRKARILYAGFLFSITFTIGILMEWIAAEVTDLIPMSIVIGVLLFIAFTMFTSAISKIKSDE